MDALDVQIKPTLNADGYGYGYNPPGDGYCVSGFYWCDSGSSREIVEGSDLVAELNKLASELAEARRDAERVAWLIVRQTTHFFPCLHPYDSKWFLNTDEDWFIECGPSNRPPTFTPEARAIIDAAMAAEERTK